MLEFVERYESKNRFDLPKNMKKGNGSESEMCFKFRKREEKKVRSK